MFDGMDSICTVIEYRNVFLEIMNFDLDMKITTRPVKVQTAAVEL